MRFFIRSVSAAFAAMLAVVALELPALADDLSGTFRITTATGKHMIVTIIENGENITGYYVGQGVAGRINGHFTGNNGNTIAYTWEERDGDSQNNGTKSGWGNMTLNNDETALKTAWGYDGQTQAVGFWNATLIAP